MHLRPILPLFLCLSLSLSRILYMTKLIQLTFNKEYGSDIKAKEISRE